MHKKALALALTVGLLGTGGGAQAELLDAGNGLVDDTVLNICWVANAGLSNTQLSGRASWDELVSWAADLEYGGYDDWRLASVSVAGGVPTGSAASVVECSTATELACRDNELGYMYYYNLGGSRGDNKTGDQTVGDVTLTDIQVGGYWSGTEFSPLPYAGLAWFFLPVGGYQEFDREDGQFDGWAVRPGQCRAARPPQPIPAISVWGLGATSLLLMVLARARLR